LELEVDRLRKQLQLVCQEVRELCNETGGQSPVRSDSFRSLLDYIRDEVHMPLALDRIVPINIQELIESVFRWQQRMENRPEARLVLNSECQRINWFPVRLRHILQNLVANALRFNDPEKGEGRVSVAVKAEAGSYEIRVVDNGLGMPANQVTYLLQPMYRELESQRSELGVGLSIVKHLVEQSGGGLSVDSGEGMGSCFVVSLPMYDQGDFLE
jgi:signal transduction histidine kinase